MTASGAIEDLISFADFKVENGIMDRKRLLPPGKKALKEWILLSFSVEDASTDHMPDIAEANMCSIFLGEAFDKRKDPEHLTLISNLQRLGDAIRMTFCVMSSPEAAFRFRIGCATMPIGTLALLQQIEAFFNQQRIIWATFMVAIGMTPVSYRLKASFMETVLT